MALQSQDQIQKGDWLICEVGPNITRYPATDEFGFQPEPITTQDKSFVGCLMKVIAINIPIMLCEVYLVKDKKALKATYPFHWSAMKWGKANKVYVRNYLKMLKSLGAK